MSTENNGAQVTEETKREPYKISIDHPTFMADYEGNEEYYSKGIARFSTLKELKDAYPKLFEMEGDFHSFS